MTAGTQGFDLDGYLARIGVTSTPTPTLDDLARMARAQLHTIPFENLDPLAGVPVRLDVASLWDKIVARRRGGYCFELNLLFAQAMAAVGFDATPLLGRVIMGRPGLAPRAHLLHVVALAEGEHIVDVGFGGPGIVEPLPLRVGEVCAQGAASFRLTSGTPGEYVLQRLTGQGWFDVYSFDRSRVAPLDIEVANYFTSTHPKVPFTSQLMCMFHGADGLFGFREGALLSFDADLSVRQREEIRDREHLTRVLTERFRIDVPSETIATVWDRLRPG